LDISDLYLPTVGYYARAKFRADHFSRSGGVRVGKKPEFSIGASLSPLKNTIKMLKYPTNYFKIFK
jgi:hypothetical protein